VTELRVRLSDDVAARLAAEAAERGTSTEDVAAEVLTRHSSAATPSGQRFAFIGITAGRPGAPSAAEAERALEDGLDDRHAR
jgi:hypothetical protein